MDEGCKQDKTKYTRMAAACKGVSEERDLRRGCASVLSEHKKSHIELYPRAAARARARHEPPSRPPRVERGRRVVCDDALSHVSARRLSCRRAQSRGRRRRRELALETVVAGCGTVERAGAGTLDRE